MLLSGKYPNGGSGTMKYGIDSTQMIRVDRVFLDKHNPRHEPFEDQDDAIAYLCREEQVLPLAKDIVHNGLNPLELFALLPDTEDTYFAAEGNRRLCALMLLNDPDLAPANLRVEFSNTATSWSAVEEIFCVVFENRDQVRLWLDRIHAGFNEGRGRRQWISEQKSRNSGYSKNDLALRILDIGEDLGFIKPEERKGRLSTVQRYVGNPIMRDTLGIDTKDPANLTTDLPDDEFRIVLQKFMGDVAKKDIHTRDNAEKIIVYSHNLRKTDGVTGERTSRHLASNPDEQKISDHSSGPQKPKKPTKISPNIDLQEALKDIPSYKLEKIYFSLCSLSLSTHTPILAVGAWSFIETLTALDGRKPETGFPSYLSAQKLSDMGMGAKNETKTIREVVKRISELGNSTKHNRTSAAFNGDQLHNDFETIDKMLLNLAQRVKGKS
jgi:hypothetical protein